MTIRERAARRGWAWVGATLLSVAAPLAAQTAPGPPAGPPPGSLVQNPQGGATPRPLPVAPPSAPVPTIVPVRPETAVPLRLPPSLAPTRAPVAVAEEGGQGARALPLPSEDPLALDPANDPILRLARAQGPVGSFRAAVAAAVARNPALDEAQAQRDEAQASLNEAGSRRYPVVDLALTGFKTIARAFSNDTGNVLERSRPRGRTDATVRVQQVLIDFGANRARIEAGNDRLLAAGAAIEDAGAQIALRAIAAWYNVYGYRALVTLGAAFVSSQQVFHQRIEERVAQGAAARGDVAQVDSYIAASQAQLADLRRSLANAEAQYTGVVGTAPPPDLGRAPPADIGDVQLAGLGADAATLPVVREAKAAANAAARDAAAARADLLPQLTGGIDAGRYGVVENRRDYDVRANLTLAKRFGGGGKQRADQARARADGADARYRRTLTDAQRDASIALSDVDALASATQAIEANYMASRQSRDVLFERFRVSRGTIFDVLGAESNYFSVAARYIQTVTELDTSRYVLLARTGRLLQSLAIDPATWDAR